MRDMRRLVSRLPEYVRALGFARGLSLAWAIERQLPLKGTQRSGFEVPPYGTVWLRDCHSDHSIFWQCLIRRQYDISQFAHWERLRKRYETQVAAGVKPLIIDCGGNIGMSAVWFAHTFPAARVVVVEPDRDNFGVLEQNIARANGRVQPILGGIWGKPAQLKITNPDSGHAAYRLDAAAAAAGNEIRAYTMNELLANAGADEILIAKIDIEGAQESLFADNTEWVDRTAAILIELDDWRLPWQGNSVSFFQCLGSRRFDYVLHGETLCCFRHLPEAH